MTQALGRLSYGLSPWQRVDLYHDDALVPEPLVVVHGGFWRHDRVAQQLEPLALRLVADGWAVAVAEYRPTWDGGAWPGSVDDVRSALAALSRRDPFWAQAPVMGHSIGAHLALSAIQGAGQPSAGADARDLVLLAPVTDLVTAGRLGVGDRAVEQYLATPLSHRDFQDLAHEATPRASSDDVRSLTVLTAGQDQAVPAELTASQLASWATTGVRLHHAQVSQARHMHLVNPERPAITSVLRHLRALRGPEALRGDDLGLVERTVTSR